MSLQDAVNRILSQWMKGTGPEDDIVIGSRIRLARNISKIPFPAAANDQQAAHVNELVRSVVDSTKDLNLNYLSLIDMPNWKGICWWKNT